MPWHMPCWVDFELQRCQKSERNSKTMTVNYDCIAAIVIAHSSNSKQCTWHIDSHRLKPTYIDKHRLKHIHAHSTHNRRKIHKNVWTNIRYICFRNRKKDSICVAHCCVNEFFFSLVRFFARVTAGRHTRYMNFYCSLPSQSQLFIIPTVVNCWLCSPFNCISTRPEQCMLLTVDFVCLCIQCLCTANALEIIFLWTFVVYGGDVRRVWAILSMLTIYACVIHCVNLRITGSTQYNGIMKCSIFVSSACDTLFSLAKTF